MYLPNSTDSPHSSYIDCIPVPGVEPDAAPTQYIEVSTAWVNAILGGLTQLYNSWTWCTADPNVLATVRGQVSKLMGLVVNGATIVDPDATTLTTGDVLINRAASGPHPVALTTDDRAAVNGVASLDGSTLIPAAQLPAAVAATQGAVTIRQTFGATQDAMPWNARAQASGVASLNASGKVPNTQLQNATPGFTGVVALRSVVLVGDPQALTAVDMGVANGVATLDGSTLVPVAQLPSAAAATKGAVTIAQTFGATIDALPSNARGAANGVAELDAGSHVPLAELSGITHSQLDAAAGITSGQIASVNPSALTGTGVVPWAGMPSLAIVVNTYTGANLSLANVNWTAINAALTASITLARNCRVRCTLLLTVSIASASHPHYLDIQCDGTGSGPTNGLTEVGHTTDPTPVVLTWLSPVLTAGARTITPVFKSQSAASAMTVYGSGASLYAWFMVEETMHTS